MLVGFLTGVGFQVGIAVLGEMVGIEIASRRTVMQVIELSRNLSHVHLPTLAVSVVIVSTIFVLGRDQQEDSRSADRGGGRGRGQRDRGTLRSAELPSLAASPAGCRTWEFRTPAGMT